MYRIGMSLAAVAAIWTGSAQAECLSRPMSYEAGEQVDSNAALFNLIEVPSDEVADYLALGYSSASCAANASARTVKIDGCTMARFGNEAVQNRFAVLLGVEPAKLCASSERLKAGSATAQDPEK